MFHQCCQVFLRGDVCSRLRLCSDGRYVTLERAHEPLTVATPVMHPEVARAADIVSLRWAFSCGGCWVFLRHSSGDHTVTTLVVLALLVEHSPLPHMLAPVMLTVFSGKFETLTLRSKEFRAMLSEIEPVLSEFVSAATMLAVMAVAMTVTMTVAISSKGAMFAKVKARHSMMSMLTKLAETMLELVVVLMFVALFRFEKFSELREQLYIFVRQILAGFRISV